MPHPLRRLLNLIARIYGGHVWFSTVWIQLLFPRREWIWTNPHGLSLPPFLLSRRITRFFLVPSGGDTGEDRSIDRTVFFVGREKWKKGFSSIARSLFHYVLIRVCNCVCFFFFLSFFLSFFSFCSTRWVKWYLNLFRETIQDI